MRMDPAPERLGPGSRRRHFRGRNRRCAGSSQDVGQKPGRQDHPGRSPSQLRWSGPWRSRPLAIATDSHENILFSRNWRGFAPPVTWERRPSSTKNHLYTFHDEDVLGTSLELKLAATSAQSAEKAERAVLAEIQRESRILSSYDPASEFGRWFRTRGQAVAVSPELFETLGLFDNLAHAHRWSAGSIRGSNLPRLESRRRGRSPADSAGTGAGNRGREAAAHWALDSSAHTPRLISAIRHWC